MAYLHGSEVVQVESVGGRVISTPASSIIALTGIAPNTYGQNELKVITNPGEASLYGKMVPGFNIPEALADIFQSGNTTVLVCNVFDPTSHTADVSLETHTIANETVQLEFAPIGTVSVFKTDGTTPVAAVLDTDYTIDEFGKIKVISNHADMTNGTEIKITYKKLDASTITATVLKGSYNPTTQVRTGMEVFDVTSSLKGYNPKIYICPRYSHEEAVFAHMRLKADKFRGKAYADAPASTTITVAIAGRGNAGTINFNTSHKRSSLFFPYIKGYDEATDTYVARPMSAAAAGLRAKVTREKGFWYNMSNKEFNGFKGPEFDMTYSLTDSLADNQKLNAVGINTLFSAFGTGLRLWGGRNASYPSDTGVESFEHATTVRDTVEEAIEAAALPFIDEPLTSALIDTIIQDVNVYLKDLEAKGALHPGSKCSYDPAQNPPAQLAAGQLVLDVDMLPTSSLERMTFRTTLNTNLLRDIAPST